MLSHWNPCAILSRIMRALAVLLVLLGLAGCYNFNNPAELGDLTGSADGGSGTGTGSTEADTEVSFQNLELNASATDAGFTVLNPGEGTRVVVSPDDPGQRVLEIDEADLRYELPSPLLNVFQLTLTIRAGSSGFFEGEPRIRVLDPGNVPALTLTIDDDGNLEYTDGATEPDVNLSLSTGQFHTIVIQGNTNSDTYNVRINGSPVVTSVAFENNITSVGRIEIRSDAGHGNREFYLGSLDY